MNRDFLNENILKSNSFKSTSSESAFPKLLKWNSTLGWLAYQAQLLKEIVQPRSCCICGTAIEAGLCCSSCRRHLFRGELQEYKPRYELFGQNLELRAHEVLHSVAACYSYATPFKELLHRVKFDHDWQQLPLLREELLLVWQLWPTPWWQQYDILVPLPTSAERRKERGFELPKELFAKLARDLGLDLGLDYVQRQRQTRPLYQLNPQERRLELAGSFVAGRQVAGRCVLLCDDIFTTGSTATAAALALYGAGAARVGMVAMTMAQL